MRRRRGSDGQWLRKLAPKPRGFGKNIHLRKAGPGRRAAHKKNPPGTKLRRFFARSAA